MAEVEILSDADLREALKSYDVNVGPITDSTRVFLKRKLGKLMSSKDVPQKSAPKTSYNTRRSIGTGRSTRSTAFKDTSKRLSLPAEKPATSKINGTSPPQTNGFSDEDDEISDMIDPPSKSGRKSLRSNALHKTQINRSDSLRQSRKSLPATLPDTPNQSMRAQTLHRIGTRSAARKSPQSYSDDSDEESQVAELRALEKKSFIPRFASTPVVSQPVVSQKNPEAKFNYTYDDKAASSTSTSLNIKKNENSTPLRGNNLTNGTKVYHRKNIRSEGTKFLSKPETFNAESIVTQAADDKPSGLSKKKPQWNSFSSFLPIGTVLFFVIIGLLYVAMKYDASPMEPKQLLGPEPNEKGTSFNVTYATIKLASEIYEYVGMHAGDHICFETNEDELVEERSMRRELKIEFETTTYYFKSLEKFIENPDWGIKLYDEERKEITENEHIGDIHFIQSFYPIMTGWCRFKRAVIKVMSRILVLTAVALATWGVIEYRKYCKKRNDEERQEMYMMVQKILDVLQKHHERHLQDDSVEPFIPIPHVRDMIITPPDRKRLSHIWLKATRFLSAAESRIRVENQRISGEDFLVWRWIQVGSPARKLGSTAREWQGEAFDQNKSVNTLINSPTPCLKVRSMFNVDCEKSEGWEMQIQDSILEKCKGNTEIQHIFVEKTSKEGLVYIKCMSNSAAGKVFKALHGSWFDARLVTVKFIRLSRFHQRFPATVGAPKVALRPSSTTPVSKFKPAETEAFEKIYPSLS